MCRFVLIAETRGVSAGRINMFTNIKRWCDKPAQSLILALVILNLCVIKTIYKSGGVYFIQFLLINLCLYLSFKGYEKYINYINKESLKGEYRIVQKTFFLELFFFILTLFSVVVSIFFDIQNLVFVNNFK